MLPLYHSFPITLKLAAVVAIAAVLTIGAKNLVSAQQGFPTPPPAARAPTPVFEPVANLAESSSVSGAARWEIQPIPQGEIPAVPPVARETIQAPGHLSLAIEAGALDRTVQLVFGPLDIESLPAPGPSQRLVKGFDLTFFDTQGLPATPTIRRPLVLEVLTDDLSSFDDDPARLVFARFEDGRWLPLVTTYFRTEKRLVVRVLELGRFAVIFEPPLF
jgi:hypothetical protein